MCMLYRYVHISIGQYISVSLFSWATFPKIHRMVFQKQQQKQVKAYDVAFKRPWKKQGIPKFDALFAMWLITFCFFNILMEIVANNDHHNISQYFTHPNSQNAE